MRSVLFGLFIDFFLFYVFVVKDPVNKPCSVVSIGEVMLIEQ